MVKDINGLGGYTPPNTVTEKGGNKTASPAAPNAPSTASTATTEGDDVQLSGSAKALQTLASKINELPEINIARAEQIKAALESGEYRIDDLVLADKILSSETFLGN